MQVTIHDVTLAVGQTVICRDVSLTAPEGQVTGVIGPNGSGKSTLLRSVYRLLRPVAGWVAIDNDDPWSLTPREAALRTAIVVQEPQADFDFTVAEVAGMGRAPHKGAYERNTAEDVRIVGEALERVGMTSFASRAFHTLSGGEKQRVLIARALAQQARVLVLDEPTNHLDIRYQLAILELVRELKVTTLVAVHDLNLAASYCENVVVMQSGRVVAAGLVDDVLEPDLLSTVFGVRIESNLLANGGRFFSFSLVGPE